VVLECFERLTGPRGPRFNLKEQTMNRTLTILAAVILSGDAIHFRENYDAFGVPPINDDRAQTVASIERIKNIASNLKAKVIQHDARDVEKLPVFPESAK
jgi:N-acyl homoserine lactone hydrolase